MLLEDKKQTGFRFKKGDKIQPTVGQYVEYILEFDQETFPEEDKKIDCAIYQKGGYKEWDKKSNRKSLDDLGLNNLTPIWAKSHVYCTRTSTHTQFLSESKDADNKTLVHIVFNLSYI